MLRSGLPALADYRLDGLRGLRSGFGSRFDIGFGSGFGSGFRLLGYRSKRSSRQYAAMRCEAE